MLSVIGVVLSGCSSPSGSTRSTGPSTVAPPTRSIPALTTSAPPRSSSPLTSGSEIATGTLVPFRTVAVGSASNRRFGLISPAGSDPFGKAVTDSVIAQTKAAGADLIQCDPGDDETLVLDCARRMATQQVDGWIVLQPGDLGESLCAVGPVDVPMIAVAASPVGCQTAGVGADDRQAGYLIGAQLGEVSRTRSHCVPDAVLILTAGVNEAVSTQRVDGIRAGYAISCPGPIAHEQLLEAGTQDRAYQAFISAITALPDDAEILVAAVNDGAALGVAAAIPEIRSTHVALVGIGADQRARCEIRANPSWIGDAALFPDRYGDVAVPALLDALAGHQIPRIMYVPTTFVTAATIGQFYDGTECPGS